MHATNSSKSPVGRSVAGEEGNALLLAVIMYLPRAAPARPLRGEPRETEVRPVIGGYALPAYECTLSVASDERRKELSNAGKSL